MSDNQALTQKDLDLVDDDTDAAAENAAAQDSEKDAADPDARAEGEAKDKGADKAGAEDVAAKDKPKQTSVLDDLGDDDDDAGADKDDAKSKDAKDDGGDGDGTDDEDKSDEPADTETKWRERIAEKIMAPLRDKLSAAKFEKRQKALMNELKRSKSQDDAILRGIAAQEKLRSGQYKQKLPEGASEAEVAAWRKENGLPEKPDQYDIPKVPGHEWTEKDQPLIDEFREVAHKTSLDQATVNELVAWQVRQQQKAEEEMEETLARVDKEDRDSCHDALRTQFGVSEFKPHMSLMARLLADGEVFGDGAGERLISARYYDTESGTWRRVTSDPAVANALINMAKYEYGEGAMVSGDARVNSQNRIKEIEDVMNTDYNRYVREGLADELLELKRKEASVAQRRGRAA